MSENSIHVLKGFTASYLELEASWQFSAPMDYSNTKCGLWLKYPTVDITNDISCCCSNWRGQ